MPSKITALLLLLFSLTAPPLQAGLSDSLGTEFHDLADTAKVDFLLERLKPFQFTQPHKALEHTALALEIADRETMPDRHANVLNARGTIHWALGTYDNARADYQLARTLYIEVGNELGVAKADNNIGLTYMEQSYYDLALEAYLASLAGFQKVTPNDPGRKATLYNNIASVYGRMGDYDAARDYYEQALAIATDRKDTNSISMLNNNLGIALEKLDEDDKALECFEKSYEGYNALNQTFGLSKVLSSMGSWYARHSEIIRAESLYYEALGHAHAMNSDFEIADGHFRLSELYYRTERFADAIKHGEKAMSMFSGSNALLPMAAVHERLSESYEKAGNSDKALFHHREFKRFQDSIYNAEKARSVDELRIQFGTRLKDEEISQLKLKDEVARWRNMGLIGIILVLVLLGLVIVFRQRAVIRKEKELKAKDREMHAAQKALAAAELRNAEIREEQLQEQLAHKSKEITTLAMNIVRRNDLLETLDKELKSLRKTVKDDEEGRIKDLSLLVAQNLSLEKERKEFQLFIQEAQQDFFRKLESQYPELTAKEKRLCAMIKLGLSSKEIAAIFNINTSSVEVSRYRLRKKLNIDKQGLKEFLDAF